MIAVMRTTGTTAGRMAANPNRAKGSKCRKRFNEPRQYRPRASAVTTYYREG